MKKILYVLSICACVILSSCQHKEQPGSTATEALAGQWYVQVDIADENGAVVDEGEDFNGGRCLLLTYNTASNTDNVLYVDDLGGFWAFKVKVPCNVNGLTFGASESELIENEAYDCGVNLWGGKIVKDGAITPSGMPADYIEFFINFDDDDLEDYGMPGISYPVYYGGTCYKVSGWRYTGFELDD